MSKNDKNDNKKGNVFEEMAKDIEEMAAVHDTCERINNKFDLQGAVGKVQHDRTDEVFNVVGIIEKGREFICALTRTEVLRDSKGRLLKDKVMGEYITQTVQTGLKTFHGSEVTRIH